jgi:ferritin
LPQVPAINLEFDTLQQVFELYYKEEYTLGEWYNEWYMECDDATIHQQLLTFIEIQRTSIGEAGDFLATIEACGNDKGAILLFDKKIK